MTTDARRDGGRLAGDCVLDGEGVTRRDAEARQRQLVTSAIRLFPEHIFLAGNHSKVRHVDMAGQRFADHGDGAWRGGGDKPDAKAGGTGCRQGFDNSRAWSDAACKACCKGILFCFVNAPDFNRGQRVAAKLSQPVLAAWGGKVPAIGGNVPVPVDTMRDKGGVIGPPLQLRCFRQNADGSEK